MPSAIFIFDSSYPNADISLEIDDASPHVVVSDRHIYPPPGHDSLQLEEVTGFAALRMNLRLLRTAWLAEGGGKCIVIAAKSVRRNQLLLNVFYSRSLCRDVVLFDGLRSTSLARSWGLVFNAAVRVVGRSVLGGWTAKFKDARFNRSMKSAPLAATPEGRLFGIYTSVRSFSLPPDTVMHEPDQRSIYGEHTRGWYLPMLSNRRHRYAVQTTRHHLRDVILHVEDANDSAVRFLFKDGRILDYPYLLGRARPHARYLVSTRGVVKRMERGIDLLHYTSGYYHWLLEGVPRILDLIDDGVNFDEYPLILPPMEPFHRQLLEVLGISPDSQVVTVGRSDWCYVRECIAPTANFPFGPKELDDPSGQPDGALLRRIRERVLDRLPTTATKQKETSKRLYISRAKATKRRLHVQSEAAVRSILEAKGFQTVCLEEITWAEQVELVSGAEFIVGLHGAGLANILFAQAKVLLEFQNPLEARPYFALMARELNIDYAYIVGALDGHSANFDNIMIDPGALTDMLHTLNLS